MLQRIVTALVTSALVAVTVGGPTPVQAVGELPVYYPFGPQVNVPISTLTDAGWTLCFSEGFDHIGTPTSVIASQCSGEYLIVTGRTSAEASVLPVLAAAPHDRVFQVTVEDSPELDNGTWWYFTPDYSMGFSPQYAIDQEPCDYIGSVPSKDDSRTLCWHMNGLDLRDGWMMGGVDGWGDFGDVYGYLREIYMYGGGTSCGTLDSTVCPTITDAGSGKLIGAPGSAAMSTAARYTWLNCRVAGGGTTSRPSDCRPGKTVTSTGARFSRLPYRISLADRRSGYLRLAVQVRGTTYYSGTFDVRP